MARRDLFVAFWVSKDPCKIWARSHQAHASAWACEFYYISYLVDKRDQTKILNNFWTLWDNWLKIVVECPNVNWNSCVKFEQIPRPLIFRPYLLWRPKLIGRALACALSERAQILQGTFLTQNTTYKSWRAVALNFFANPDPLVHINVDFIIS